MTTKTTYYHKKVVHVVPVVVKTTQKNCHILPLWHPLKHHLLSRRRVRKRDPRGVEVETVGAVTVEVVASDGAVETFRVGAVDAQLVRAACERMQLYNVLIDHTIERHGGLAMRFIYLLERAVHQIRGERQLDAPLLPYRQGLAVQYCDVGFLYLSVSELFLQMIVRGFVLRHKHQPAGVHVQTMDYQRRFAFLTTRLQY